MKKKILAVISILGLFGVAVEGAPVWWYILCMCITIACLIKVHKLDPNFWLESGIKG